MNINAHYVQLLSVALVVWSNFVFLGNECEFTPIAELRATSRVEAAKRSHVRVRGTVSLVGEGLASVNKTPALNSFCIEDESAGIWVNVAQAIHEKIWLKPTDDLLTLRERLEIEFKGLIDPGTFAPIILPTRNLSHSLLGERQMKIYSRALLEPEALADLWRLIRLAPFDVAQFELGAKPRSFT